MDGGYIVLATDARECGRPIRVVCRVRRDPSRCYLGHRLDRAARWPSAEDAAEELARRPVPTRGRRVRLLAVPDGGPIRLPGCPPPDRPPRREQGHVIAGGWAATRDEGPGPPARTTRGGGDRTWRSASRT